LLHIYRKISIDRPTGIHFLSTNNFWIKHKIKKIKTYSERVETFLSEYALSFFYDKWFRSYVSKKSEYSLVYLSSFYCRENCLRVTKWQKFQNEIILLIWFEGQVASLSPNPRIFQFYKYKLIKYKLSFFLSFLFPHLDFITLTPMSMLLHL